MPAAFALLRRPTLLVAVAAFAAGYAAHTHSAGRLPVFQAQAEAQSRGASGASASREPLEFQLSGVGPATALTVWNPVDKNLYVYQGINSGGSHISCSFSLQITRPGAPIDRQNCPVGSLLP